MWYRVMTFTFIEITAGGTNWWNNYLSNFDKKFKEKHENKDQGRYDHLWIISQVPLRKATSDNVYWLRKRQSGKMRREKNLMQSLK